MTRVPHDMFAKDLLSSFLAPLGKVTRNLELAPEPLFVDLAFEGPDPAVTPDELAVLGLLGRLAAHPCYFEPHRAPLRHHHLTSAMAKLTCLHFAHSRERRRTPPTPHGPPPRLWVLSPAASHDRILASGLTPATPDSGIPAHLPPYAYEGLYTLGPDWNLGLVVIRELPRSPDTLLLRLLGAGDVQLTAARELALLPALDPAHRHVLDLIDKWRIFLPSTPRRTFGETETTMLLMTAGQRLLESTRLEGLHQGRTEGLQQGRTEGLRQGRHKGQREALRAAISRLWLRRFGEANPELEQHLAALSSLQDLEALFDELVTAPDRDAAMARMRG